MSQIRPILPSQKTLFDSLASHPLQSWAWGEFREKLGQKVIRLGEFDGDKLISVCQFFIHSFPHIPHFPQTPYSLAYCPRSSALSPDMLAKIKKIAQKNKCIFVKFEPGILKEDANLANLFNERRGGSHGGTPKKGSPCGYSWEVMTDRTPERVKIIPGKPLFTPYTFQIDLTQSAENLLKNMRPKTRYNINLARKKGVFIEENNSDEAFKIFQQLTEETTQRQKFFAHSRRYRELMWRTMKKAGIARLLIARYSDPPLFLSAWILFFHNSIGYYPYGASSSVRRELMASNLLAWEALLLAKKNGCQKFDFWGALGPPPVEDPEHSRRTGGPDKNDPWYGFHRFKEGYGGKLVQFVGTYDLVIRPFLYRLYNFADRLRWLWLRHS